MRNRVLAAVLAACLGACAFAIGQPACANIFAFDGHDPRAPSPRTGDDRIYAPVGVVVTGQPVAASEDGRRMVRTRGSVFLVSPCYALTNYHAVFGLAFDGPDPDRDYPVTVSVGADPDYTFRWTVRAHAVRWGKFNRRKEHDWALLKLDGCVGGQPDVGWLDLSAQPGPTMLGEMVALAGYPADKTIDTLWVQPSCKIEAMQDGTAKVLHACAVHGGASGGPLIERVKDAVVAVAIQCGELNATEDPLRRWDPRHANTAVTIAEVMQDDEARRLIADDLAAFPGLNPALSVPPAPVTPAAPDALPDDGVAPLPAATAETLAVTPVSESAIADLR
jgi:V8-like Glu-specific endopeptidase